MKEIQQAEFKTMINNKWPVGKVLLSECGWFQEGNLLGVVTFDRIDKDFGWVVLKQDLVGQYRGIDVNVSYPSFDAAVTAVKLAMERHK